MKRFIRTKDGKIHEIADNYRSINDCGFVFAPECKVFFDQNDDFKEPKRIEIIKQADTIEELIECGDLICKENELYVVIKHKDDLEVCLRQNYNHFLEITELYTKQGRNYVLVAEKVDGEWRIL